MALKHILTPVKLGPATLPNRVVRTAHGTGIGGGTMNDALVEYHAARAKGGVGLTVIEAAQVHRTFYPFFNAGAPGLVEGYRKLMERVRPHGMKVFQQLGHLGNEIPQADGTPPWSSSDTVGALLGIQSQPMTKAQIAELVDCYFAAAKDCETGGLDGVEVHMAHGYLLHEFLSPLSNVRNDAYGGARERRMRFPLEVFDAVRAACPDKPVGVRVSATDWVDGGWALDDTIALARELAARGCDFIDVSSAGISPKQRIESTPGLHVPFARAIRGATRLPTIAVGLITEPAHADAIVANGDADLVALARGILWNPRWPWHAAKALGASVAVPPQYLRGVPRWK